MITVSVKQLMGAIEEADAFKLPDMSEGTDYLYNRLYKRLLHGEDVRLSEIDYRRFELDDVEIMRDLYADVLEPNENKAGAMARTLRSLQPVAAAAAFI